MNSTYPASTGTAQADHGTHALVWTPVDQPWS
jgi:hypothetical protein